MNRTRVTAVVGKIALVTCGVLTVEGLLFRSTLYGQIPVEPGEPYGYGDVFDGFLSLGVKGAALFAGIWGVILVLAKSLGNQRPGMLAERYFPEDPNTALLARHWVVTATYRLMQG